MLFADMKANDSTSLKVGAIEETPDAPEERSGPGISLSQARLALVAAQPFFKGLKPKQLKQLASSALEVKFQEGQSIFREGDPANRFYLILKGRVALEADDDEGRTNRVTMLGPGDDLGWSWLFPPYYLHFSAYAVEPTEAIFFYGTRLRKQCDQDVLLAYEIMKRVAKVVVQRLEISRRPAGTTLLVKHD